MVEQSSTRVDLALEEQFRLAAAVVRPSTCEVIIKQVSTVLEPRIMRVLVALARRSGTVVTRDELIEFCWDGRVVSDDALNRPISRLRALAASFPDVPTFRIETLARVGYRLFEAGAVPEEHFQVASTKLKS